MDTATVSYLATRALLAAASPRGDVRMLGGIHVAFSGIATASFNTAFVTGRLADPRGEIGDLLDHAAARGLDVHAYVQEGADPAAEEALRSAGFAVIDREPWMNLPVDAVDADADPGQPVIRRADDREGFDRHLEVAGQAFDLPLDVARAAFPDDLVDHPLMEFYVASQNGVDCGAGAMVITDQVANIQNIGTIRAFERRGIATAMTWHLVRRARTRGCRWASLQASPTGEPVYRRMGFETEAVYLVFGRSGS